MLDQAVQKSVRFFILYLEFPLCTGSLSITTAIRGCTVWWSKVKCIVHKYGQTILCNYLYNKYYHSYMDGHPLKGVLLSMLAWNELECICGCRWCLAVIENVCTVQYLVKGVEGVPMMDTGLDNLQVYVVPLEHAGWWMCESSGNEGVDSKCVTWHVTHSIGDDSKHTSKWLGEQWGL